MKGYDIMDNFKKKFEELIKNHDNTVVFNDFLAYSVDQFRIDYHQPHFHKEGYTKQEYKIFYELFEQMILSTNNKLNQGKQWYDMLGHFYEDVVQSKWKAGDKSQFFTPVSVVEALAELTVPKTVSEDKVLTAYDSSCGSSRTLLAYHVRRPFDILVGGDLDHTSCLMSVVNFVLHGCKGVIINTNSLSGEFFGAWKVNEFVDLGLPFTVEYMLDTDNLYRFIGEGLRNRAEEKVVELNPTGKETVQTTLI